MTPEQEVAKAELLSQFAHFGQKDKAGLDYFRSHILTTVRFSSDRAEQADEPRGEIHLVEAVAYLHDVVEDTPVTIEMLEDFDFSPAVVEGVRLMTRGRVSTEGYYGRCKDHRLARYAKAGDMDSNTMPTRVHKLDPVVQIRLLEKYQHGFEILEAEPKWDLDKMIEEAKGLASEESS